MRVKVLIIAILIICSCSLSFAQSPPFRKVTIKGKTIEIYNKVSLFEHGSAKKPFKTENISEYYGTDSIDIDLPYDMKKKDNYFYTDMRFWGDKNDNGIRELGNQCVNVILSFGFRRPV